MGKRVLVIGGLVAAAALAFLYPTLRGKPWSIDHFFARVFLEFALERPLLLSQLRILEPWGIDFHADELDDFSVAFERDELREAKRNLEILRSYDFESLSPGQRRSAEVLDWFLALQADREPFLLHDYPVNQMNGVQKGLPDSMITVHRLASEEDAEDYLARLRAFDRALEQITEGVDARARLGVIPPRFVISAVRAELADFLAPPPAEHVLAWHFATLSERIEGLSEARREELLEQVVEAVETVVYPAYRELDAALAELEPLASEDAGVWALPDGEAYYRWQLRRHTTTRLTPDEIHALGLAEVERIQDEIREILAAEGVPVEDLGLALRGVALLPRYRYDDSDRGREALLADYTAIVDAAREKLPELFGRLPEAPVVVERVPPFLEDGSAGAYYRPPAFDGSRPGVFYVNLRNVLENPRFRMRTLAHHEALPGHHLQIALAQEMEDAPFFRRVLPFTAYSEGWALYAERLAGEAGLLPEPSDRLGMLVDELFRAVRLVVDTGMHHRRWSRERAVDTMLALTGKPESEVRAEIDRYVVMPGQATAYKVGQLQIFAFREEARRRLGEDFDLRAFHDAVLGSGALPLELLEEVVEEWIASQEGGASEGS